MDFVEICNLCTRNVIIKAAKRIFNSDKICCSYYDFYFGVTFLEHTVGHIGDGNEGPVKSTAAKLKAFRRTLIINDCG